MPEETPAPAPDAPYGVRLVVAYDGAGFAGWQSQAAQRTVQDALRDAVARLDPSRPRIWGASRTDAGVHAEGQVAAFATSRNLAPHGWTSALNRYLPADVSVRSAAPCAPGYNPRFDAVDKTYRYLIHLGGARHPLLRQHSWHLGRLLTRGRDLDLAAMQAAAQGFVGTHDYAAFQAADDPRENTRRHVQRVEVIPDFNQRGDLVAIEVQGHAFLKNMVRIMVGTLVEIGRRRLGPDHVARLLDGGTRQQAGPTAPAHGLCLVHIALGRPADGGR